MGASRSQIPLAGSKRPVTPGAGIRPSPTENTLRGPAQPSREVRPDTDRPGIKFGTGTSHRSF